VVVFSRANFNTVGGSAPGDGNVIAFNGGDGVRISGSGGGAIGNSIRANSIHSNTGLPINNTNGGNQELTPPTLTSSDGVTVTGTACPYCIVDIFSDTAGDPRIYEGSATAGVGGNWSFSVGGGLVGPNLVATQTDIFGNTSEVSGSIAVIDNDGDGVGDAADPDDDNDGLPDVNDLCPLLAEDFDGFQDSDGCPDPDNDLDGICDPGQSSPSCTGSDMGKTAFFPAGHVHSDPATIDCRNMPEDLDGFKDSDGCPEPDNDNDGFPDAVDQCPGTDDVAGGDGVLGSFEDDNHNGILDGGEDVTIDGVLTTDDGVLTFEDYDGILDTDGCHDSPGDDKDGDGFTDEAEVLFIGTNAAKPCGNNGWPADLDPNNTLDIGDFNSFLFPLRADSSFNKWGHPVPDAMDADIERWDLDAGDGVIDIGDINAINPAILAPTARPPMFGGQPAFLSDVGNGIGGCPFPP